MDKQENVQIVEAQIQNANILFPILSEKIAELGNREKIVVAVSGGSGAGKTGMARLLKESFEEQGIGAFVVSGDDYPQRIPIYNDAERLRIFRMGGLRGLIEEHLYSEKIAAVLMDLQKENRDADESLVSQYEWLLAYQKSGDRALFEYLGTEKELCFSELSALLAAFKAKEETIWFRRMGREVHEVWYEKTEVQDKQILILEWTHGNSGFLTGIDVSVVLMSTPEETLENRKKRNRDAGIGTPFVARVLRLEQQKIEENLHRADIVQDMQGRIGNFL